MIKTLKQLVLASIVATTLYGCGGTSAIISTPVENIDSMPLKETKLTEAEKNQWQHKDLILDTLPGMSVDKAYAEIIKRKKGKKVIVAVIDSGIDIDHEDLRDVVWTNKGEVPNNGKDDDNNGYVDDVHGWNFLGDAYDEQLEYIRLLASGNTSHPRYEEAKAEYDKEYQQTLSRKTRYDQLLQNLKTSHEAVKTHLKKDSYTKDELNAIETQDETLKNHVAVVKQFLAFGFDTPDEAIEEIKGGVTYFTEKLNFNLNKDFNGRTTGDNPDDFSQKTYGNGNVKHIKEDESHGTHVAGIIAAKRNNDLGMNGVANNVEIMSIRTVPNGDEYDKDVALSIRYAVDNGAKVINTSFGKGYSPHSAEVREAIKYASDNDVVIVNAAGNDGNDLDKINAFPNDAINNGEEVSETFITVGALAPKYGSEMVASYSNYGKINVDVFAPGSAIYSTVPESKYKAMQGTSMASPAVAGVAAVLRSQYPSLTAAEVKQIILSSGVPIKTKVLVAGDDKNVQEFTVLSTSGKIANLYNALIIADRYVKSKKR